MKQLKTLLIITTFLFLPASSVLSYSALVPVKNKNGMYQAVFQLERRGEVQVNLPSDITLDEKVSGSVIYSGGLSQFELLIEGNSIPLHGGGNFIYRLPGNVSTGVIKVTLRYSNGIEIGKAFFPVGIGKLRQPSVIPDDKDFMLPYFGNSGMPLAVKGVFDGNYTNTLITLAEQRLRILAESTTSCVFVTTNSVSGEGVLKISELGKQQETKFTNLAVVKIEDRQPSGFNYANENKTGQEIVRSEPPKKPDLSRISPQELHVDIPGEVETNIPAEYERTEIKRKKSVSRSPAASANSSVRSAPSYSELEGEIEKHFNSEFYPVNMAGVNYSEDNTLLSERDYTGLTGKAEKGDNHQESSIENDTGDERQMVAKSIKFRDEENKVEKKPPVAVKKVAEPQKLNKKAKKADEKENVDKDIIKAVDRVKDNKSSYSETFTENTERKVPEKTGDKVTAVTSASEQEKENIVEKKKIIEKGPDVELKPEKTSDIIKKTEEKTAPEKVAGLKKEPSKKEHVSQKVSGNEIVKKAGKEEIREVRQVEKKDHAKPPENTFPEDGNIIDIIRPLPDVGDNEISSIAESLKNDPGESTSGEFKKGNKFHNGFCIQLASFKKESEIEVFVAKMKKMNFKEDVKMVKIPGRGEWHRVRICEFKTRKEAESFISRVDKKKLNVSGIYVTQY